jgi:hypothetical protein
MSDVAAYHVFVCALFLVQGGKWTAYTQTTYLPTPETTHTQIHDAATSLIIMNIHNFNKWL